MIVAALSLWLSAPALAQDSDPDSETAADVACFVPQLTDHRPADGQDAVPTDAVILLAFSSDGCLPDVQVTVSSATDTVYDETLRLDAGDPLVVVDPLGFDDDESYTVMVVALGYADEESEEFTFSTGAEPSVEVVDPPTVSLYELTGVQTDRDWLTVTADLHVSATAVPSGISYVEVADTRSPAAPVAVAFVPGTGELELSARWSDAMTDGEVCLAARQIDAAGIAGDWGEPACAVPEIDDSAVDWSESGEGCGGCTAGPAGALGWALLLPLLAVGRRRS